MHKYFDVYLNGIENGWDKDTPKVRWSALRFGDREAIELPIPDTEWRIFPRRWRIGNQDIWPSEERHIQF